MKGKTASAGCLLLGASHLLKSQYSHCSWRLLGAWSRSYVNRELLKVFTKEEMRLGPEVEAAEETMNNVCNWWWWATKNLGNESNKAAFMCKFTRSKQKRKEEGLYIELATFTYVEFLWIYIVILLPCPLSYTPSVSKRSMF